MDEHGEHSGVAAPLLQNVDGFSHDNPQSPIKKEIQLSKVKSTIKLAAEYTIRVLADFARALDDIFGYYSALATLGFTLILVPFFIIGFLLSIAYFALHLREKKKNESTFGKKAIETLHDTHFSDEECNRWMIELGEDNEFESIESIKQYLREKSQDELFDDMEATKDKIEQQMASLNGNDISHRIQLLYKQFNLKLNYTQAKTKNSAINIRFLTLKDPDYNKPDEEKTVSGRLKSVWYWVLGNYKKIISGVTIAATFCSLTVLLFGPALLTLFPLNIIIAVSLVLLISIGNYFYKKYFKDKFKNLTKTYRSENDNDLDKKLQMELIVKAKQINRQIGLEMEQQKVKTAAKQSADNTNIGDERLLRQLAQSPEPEVNAFDNPSELVEVKALREKIVKGRYVANYILPSLLALNAGYSIGATLLQLALVSGIPAPILPFILVGLVFAAIYVAHRLWRSYHENRDEQTRITNLNTDVFNDEKISLYRNRLKLMGQNTIDMNGEKVKVKRYLTESTATQVVDDFKEVYLELQAAFDKKGVGQADRERIINLIQAQALSLHSTDIKTNLSPLLSIKLEMNVENDEPKEQPKNKLMAAWQAVVKFFRRYIKSLAKGTGFGLGIAASLIIFLIGSSTFVTVPVAVSIMVCGAVIGVSISFFAEYLFRTRKDFEKKFEETEHAIEDKDKTMELLIRTKESLWQVNHNTYAMSESHSMDREDKVSFLGAGPSVRTQPKRIQRSYSEGDVRALVKQRAAMLANPRLQDDPQQPHIPNTFGHL